MWIQTCENVFNYPLKYTVALLLYKYSWVFYTYTEEEAVFWGGGKEGSARKPEEVVPLALCTSLNPFAHHAAWRGHTMGGLLAPHPLHNSSEKPQNSDSNLGMTTHVGFSQSRGNFNSNQFKQQYSERQQCKDVSTTGKLETCWVYNTAR